jgi:AAA+ ATPase superfamily predicted ATPase
MLLRQFRSFHVRHFPDDMEQLIEYFAVFGGLGWEIDIDAPLEEQIITHILDNYGHLYNEICRRVTDDPSYHRLLSAIAVGDRRMHSAFKRARISEAKGGQILNYLRDSGTLEMEYSREAPPVREYPKQKLKREVARHRISHKMRFTSPFLRFWFYFVAPLHRELETGNYEKLLERFEQRRRGFTGRVFEALSDVFLERMHQEDPIVDSGSYWDRQVEIDIFAATASGRIIIGECKWTNHKINKSELTKLLGKCETIDLQPDIIALFCKRGFSKELEQMKGPNLELYSAKDFEWLLQGVTPGERIKGFPRPE